MFVRGTLLDNIRAPYWLLQEGWKIRRFVLLYHFFSTAYYARVNRTESSSSQKEFEDIVRSEGAIIISKRDRFPPDTEILRLNSKGWTFKEFKCSTEVYFFFSPSIGGTQRKICITLWDLLRTRSMHWLWKNDCHLFRCLSLQADCAARFGAGLFFTNSGWYSARAFHVHTSYLRLWRRK